MKRLGAVIWIFAVVTAMFFLYMVKYQVQTLRTQIADTSRDLEAEKEALHVVAAEWAYLNRPQRLQQLAAKYLATSGLMASQIAEIEAIPYPNKLEASVDPESAPKEGIHPASFKVTKSAGDEE